LWEFDYLGDVNPQRDDPELAGDVAAWAGWRGDGQALWENCGQCCII
jgi:hypothetical protein